VKKLVKMVAEWKLVKAVLKKLRGRGDKDPGINA